MRLEIDGQPISMSSSCFGEGFYDPEGPEEQQWRWTGDYAFLIFNKSEKTRIVSISTNNWHTTLIY